MNNHALLDYVYYCQVLLINARQHWSW